MEGALLKFTYGAAIKAIWHYSAHLTLNITVCKVEQRYKFTTIFGKNWTLCK